MALCECGCGMEVNHGRRFINGHNRREPAPEPTFCGCGCGELANPGRRFIYGHQNRGDAYWKRQRGSMLCECGCGGYATPGHRFIYGHSRIGSKHSPETRKKQSDAAINICKSPAHREAIQKARVREKIPIDVGCGPTIDDVTTNKECGIWLAEVSEILLSNIFENVRVMPPGNVGYDAICANGFKIDVKSATIGKNNMWTFGILKNKIADYFFCMAFDNRDTMNLLHIWLIPGNVVNHLSGISISSATIEKWSPYEQSIDNAIACCNAMIDN